MRDLETAQNAALAAIARLADAGHRLANEHAHALDALRAEVESLRTMNQALRERVAELEHRCEHTASILEPAPQPAETVREVVRGTVMGWPVLGAEGQRRALCIDGGGLWSAYDEHEILVRRHLTEAQAIAWVLVGVLP